MPRILTHAVLVLIVSAIFSLILCVGVLAVAMIVHGAGPGWAFTLNRAPWIAGIALVVVGAAHLRHVLRKRRGSPGSRGDGVTGE